MTSLTDKYKYGKIYKLTSKHTDKIYIGSTIMHLYQRLSQHNVSYKKQKSRTTSWTLFDFGDVNIELIEEFSCSSKVELLQREFYIIYTTPNCVNKLGSSCINESKKSINKSSKGLPVLFNIIGGSLLEHEERKTELPLSLFENKDGKWNEFFEIIKSLGYKVLSDKDVAKESERQRKYRKPSAEKQVKESQFKAERRTINNYIKEVSPYRFTLGRRVTRQRIRSTFIVVFRKKSDKA